MKNTRKSRSIVRHVLIIVLTSWLFILTVVVITTYPLEATRLPNIDGHKAAAAQPHAASATDQENGAGSTIADNPAGSADWTFMVYMAADDDTLEKAALNDFHEMANVSSNENINIVVQLDRIPGYDLSHGDWTDCRRFLITEGMTPSNVNEVMSIGEVNMGDPVTLVNFVEWAASNYPAQKYALIISSHGKGWEGCCWDETSDNDNMDLSEIQNALSGISEFMGRPLDLIGFDACLMGTTEVAYEVHDYASVMVASEHSEPSSGWPYDAVLTQLTATPDINAAQLATIIVDSYYTAYAPTSYTMAAIDLTKIDMVVGSLSDLAQALVVYDGTDTQTIKDYAGTVMTTLDEAVINERHGTYWLDSHGLTVYFPRQQEGFDPAYNSNTVSGALISASFTVTPAGNTPWEEFLSDYYTSAGGDWISAAREATQQYYTGEYMDLYDFCQNLIDSEP